MPSSSFSSSPSIKIYDEIEEEEREEGEEREKKTETLAIEGDESDLREKGSEAKEREGERERHPTMSSLPPTRVSRKATKHDREVRERTERETERENGEGEGESDFFISSSSSSSSSSSAHAPLSRVISLPSLEASVKKEKDGRGVGVTKYEADSSPPSQRDGMLCDIIFGDAQILEIVLGLPIHDDVIVTILDSFCDTQIRSQFIEYLIRSEVGKTEEENTLFRGTSAAVKVLRGFLNLHALEYAKTIAGPIVDAVSE